MVAALKVEKEMGWPPPSSSLGWACEKTGSVTRGGEGETDTTTDLGFRVGGIVIKIGLAIKPAKLALDSVVH
jgi:hypothetical protein